MSDQLMAGSAKQDITPPIGSELCGFIARIGRSTTLHDPLAVKALVLQRSNLKVAIVSLDILGLNPAQSHQLKLSIQQQTGIEHIMLLSSHTHSGPGTDLLNGCGETPVGYMDMLREKTVQAVFEASRHLTPVTLHSGKATSDILTALIRNRRQPDGPIDPDLNVLVFQNKATDKPLAVLFRYTCHPVVLGSDNQGISNDWVGYAARHIEEKLGNSAVALFANGPAGNINPSHRGTLDIARRMGEAIGTAVLDIVNSPETNDDHPDMAFTTHTVALDLMPLFPTEELVQLHDAYVNKIDDLRDREPTNSLLAIKSLRVFADWVSNALDQELGGRAPYPVTVEVQGLRIGQSILIALPGEVFIEYGLALKKEFGDAIIPIGYANGNVGYIPWHDAYPKGGYEVDSAYKYYGYPSCIAPEGGDRLLSAARQLCRTVIRT